MRQSSERPDIKGFLDVREYLRAVYGWRKHHNRKFSYAEWAKEFGFQSRSFLRLVIMGKRSITERSLSLFLQKLELNRAEQDYFAALVGFNQAPSLAARELYAGKLRRLYRQSSGRNLVQDIYHFLSSHQGPRVQALLSLADFQSSDKELADRLHLTLGQVQELLSLLEKIGLARSEQRGDLVVWRATVSNFEVKEELGNVALQSFHRRSLEDAIHAIDQNPQERRYDSALLPLTAEEFREAHAEILDFLKDLTARHRSDSGLERRLYQLNVNLVPVSKPIVRASSSREPARPSHTQPSRRKEQ